MTTRKTSFVFTVYITRLWILYIPNIILSAERYPLLDKGLPKGSPKRPVLHDPHPTLSRNPNKIVVPSCWRPNSSPWTPVEYFLGPSAIKGIPNNVQNIFCLFIREYNRYIHPCVKFTLSQDFVL